MFSSLGARLSARGPAQDQESGSTAGDRPPPRVGAAPRVVVRGETAPSQQGRFMFRNGDGVGRCWGTDVGDGSAARQRVVGLLLLAVLGLGVVRLGLYLTHFWRHS